MDKQRILVVDDEEKHWKAIKSFLEIEGFSVSVATNESDGRRQMESHNFDLAIVDLWLREKEDENNPSGLNLIRDVRPGLKKIVWTAKPNTETARKALGTLLNGHPAAVGYIFKDEGLEELLKAIKLALLPMDPVVEGKILKEFGVSGTVALNNRIKDVGPERAFHLLQRGFQEATAEFAKLGETESRRVTQLHGTGLALRVLGMLTILIALGFLVSGSIKGGVVSSITSAVIHAINALFSVREDKAHRRMRMFLEELLKVQHNITLLQIAESLESEKDRAIYKRKVLDHLLDMEKAKTNRNMRSRKSD